MTQSIGQLRAKANSLGIKIASISGQLFYLPEDSPKRRRLEIDLARYQQTLHWVNIQIDGRKNESG